MSCAIKTRGLGPLRVKGPGTLFLFYPQISDPKQTFLTVTGNTHKEDEANYSDLLDIEPVSYVKNQTKLLSFKNRPRSAVLSILIWSHGKSLLTWPLTKSLDKI